MLSRLSSSLTSDPKIRCLMEIAITQCSPSSHHWPHIAKITGCEVQIGLPGAAVQTLSLFVTTTIE